MVALGSFSLSLEQDPSLSGETAAAVDWLLLRSGSVLLSSVAVKFIASGCSEESDTDIFTASANLGGEMRIRGDGMTVGGDENV